VLTSIFSILTGFRELDPYLFTRFLWLTWFVSLSGTLIVFTYYGVKAYRGCRGNDAVASLMKKNIIMMWIIIGGALPLLIVEIAIPRGPSVRPTETIAIAVVL